MFIKEIKPWIIRNSRGRKTICIEIRTLNGIFAASSPCGASKGKFEAPAWSKGGVELSLKMLEIFAKRMKHKNFLIKAKEDNFEVLRKFEKEIRIFEARYGRIGANCVYALEASFLKAAGIAPYFSSHHFQRAACSWSFGQSFHPPKGKMAKTFQGSVIGSKTTSICFL